ncbi:hypothetical protein KAR91_76470 [Candidatus Pacearchaeota archaeon]|nr:hypothetical protein [Candidatus Pacearchaeota archaeon]
MFKFIISFLLSPLRIIRDFLVFNYDTTVLKSGLFLPIISIILIVGFLLIVKESPTHLFNAIIKTDSLLLRFSFIAWPFLCVFLNLLTLALIELFAQPYKHSTAQLESKLNKKIEETQKDLTKKIDGISDSIIGHKLWAQKNIFRLFSELSGIDSGKRAKWFIVNFLSHLTNERIKIESDNDGKLYTISTGKNDWPLLTYSSFLARNMEHAEEEIFWLVDPNDFFEILLPEFASYVMASQTVAMYKEIPSITWKSMNNDSEESFVSYVTALSVYEDPPKDQGITSEQWKPIYDKIINKHPTDNIELWIDDPIHADDTWTNFHLHVLQPMVEIGEQLVKMKGLVSDNEIMDGFRKLSDEFLNNLLPHLRAFRSSNVHKKKRVLFLGYGMPSVEAKPAEKQKWVKQKISYYLDKHKDKWINIQSQPLAPEVLKFAIELFKISCGGMEVLTVNGITLKNPYTGSERSSWDVGCYDQQFIVSAEDATPSPSSENPGKKKLFAPRRRVDWHFGTSQEEKKLYSKLSVGLFPQRLKDALQLLNTAHNGGIITFEDFLNFLINKPNEFSMA